MKAVGANQQDEPRSPRGEQSTHLLDQRKWQEMGVCLSAGLMLTENQCQILAESHFQWDI